MFYLSSKTPYDVVYAVVGGHFLVIDDKVGDNYFSSFNVSIARDT